MSEFLDVVKQWRRLCNSYNMCPVCPLKVFEVNGYFCGGICLDWAKNVDWRKLEDTIKKWAAEHPEPVYPTWEEWLIEQGVLDSDIGYAGDADGDWQKVTQRMYDPIPADIAEKLGIKPKEAGT